VFLGDLDTFDTYLFDIDPKTCRQLTVLPPFNRRLLLCIAGNSELVGRNQYHDLLYSTFSYGTTGNVLLCRE
jgi:hypothetical protein